MPRPCSVCTHPARAEINRAVLAQTSFRTLAARFGLGRSALSRHARAHPLNPRGVVSRGNRRATRYSAPCPRCGAPSPILLRCYACPNGCPVTSYGWRPERAETGRRARQP